MSKGHRLNAALSRTPCANLAAVVDARINFFDQPDLLTPLAILTNFARSQGGIAMGHIAPKIDTAENALAQCLVNHWQTEFAKLPVLEDPVQHFFCDRVWPEEVYAEMLRLLPPHDVYKPMNIKEWVNAESVSTRDRCFLPEILDQLDKKRAAFWRQIWLAMTANSLKRLLFGKFRKDVALRLSMSPDSVESVPAYVGFSLTRDIEDYRISPHPDGWPSVVTAQFYLPADTSQEDLGTSFYAEVPWLKRPFLGRFQEIKRMPFLPNSGYAFAVNDLPGHRSLHGRELIKPGAGVRHTILIRWTAEEKLRKRGQEGISKTHNFF
jgi:hypothetical protein